MKRLIVSNALALLVFQTASAHVGSINLFVDLNNQLYTLETFAPGQFIRFGDIEVSSATPGFGVDFPANNVAPGASLDLEIVQDLLYWDGNGLGTTDVAIDFDAPQWDNEGNLNNTQVGAYSVSQTSGLQTGMHWGNYSGNNFWEAHSLYFLDDLDAPAGVYGMVVRMRSDVHVDTDPTLIPFIYDPNFQWTPGQETDAIALLREATVAHAIADLNVDGHVNLVDIDALVAESAAGTNSAAFDLTGDGLVNQNDIVEWLAQAGTAKAPTSKPFLAGDSNLDGTVDGQDFVIWNSNKFTTMAAWSSGDFNGDGFVNGVDFVVWNSNKFLSVDAGALQVPEPMKPLFPALLCFALLLRVMRCGD